ncbi:MAG: Rieske 2Fe-2S domain-containing protein [Ferruginibacter sp.]
MSARKYQWHKIADSTAELMFSASGLLEVEAGGKKLCLAVKNDRLYACAAKCPHAGGRMADGFTDALGNIVCPLHRYRFSLEKGYNSSGEGFHLKTYPVERREDGIYVGIEESNLFNWLK